MSSKQPKRMSVSLKEKDSNRLEKLHEGLGISKSKIFRKSLEMLYELDIREVDLSSLFDYLYLLHDRKHIALNKEIMKTIIEELNTEKSEIKDKFAKIGRFYYREYEEMNKKSIGKILKHLENHNWFRAIKKDDGKFTLEMRVKNSCILFKCFLKGVFEESPHEVQLEKVRDKILLNKTN